MQSTFCRPDVVVADMQRSLRMTGATSVVVFVVKT